MTRTQLLQSIEETFKDAHSIVEAKNKDYAGKDGTSPFANFEFSSLIGQTVEESILGRVVDKIARIYSIVSSGETSVKSEAVSDTIRDCCNYLAIMKAYIDSKEEQNQEKTTRP